MRFHSEDVRLRVEAESLEVTGLYRFVNLSGDPAERSLRYPFPRDSLMGSVGSVTVRARPSSGAWKPVTFVRSGAGNGVFWHLRFPALDTLEVECRYRQALLAPHARYIVTTTGAWERPLEAAAFEICLPAGAVPRRFSFPFRPSSSGNAGCFSYEASLFAPDRDIEAWWDP